MGARQRTGYGLIRHNGRLQGTHRVAYEGANGPIPTGFNVLHKCDNPPCIEVDHLFLGTQMDNVRDMWAKGRWRGRGKRKSE